MGYFILNADGTFKSANKKHSDDWQPLSLLAVDKDGNYLSVYHLAPDENGIYQPDLATIKSDTYIAEFNQVDEKRRSLYTEMVDPLESEAIRNRRNKLIAEAEVLEAQADAAVEKIKTENPWPVLES